MPSKKQNPSLRKEGLAQRAAKRKHERSLKRGVALAHNCERGQLIAWFSKQPTQSLREFKRAIDAARLTRLQWAARNARRIKQSKAQELKNLQQ